MRLNYRQIEHEKSPVEDMMPIITCKVTDEEKELIDRLAGTKQIGLYAPLFVGRIRWPDR